jgi:hypothetical protein
MTSTPTNANARFVGVTVMPEYLQTETVDRVLDNLVERAGVTAVTTSPYVMEPADEQTGAREPPLDAEAGKARLLERPLWGRRELLVRTAPSFEPEVQLYRGLRYQPAAATELTRSQGKVIDRFLAAARRRGLKVYLQVQAAIPPGYRVQFGGPADDDVPRLPDGRVPQPRVANNGSLASPHIRDYAHALLRDLCRRYPEVDGIRVDWPEYPPYSLDDAFVDFGDHARRAAERLGFDWQRMQREVDGLYRLLHGGLTDEHLRRWNQADGGRHRLLRALANHPGLLDFLAFKAQLVDELLAGFRQTLTDVAGQQMQLMPNAFPPPFTLASGLDFARAARYSSAISVKLYTMHWAMMLRFYGDAMRRANPRVSEALLVRALVGWFDIADDAGLSRLDDYAYPEPDQPHPVGRQAQVGKLAEAQAEAGEVPVYGLAHGYGPADDFRRRLQAACEGAPQGVWINRYCYLSDEKLEIIGQVCCGHY